MYRKTSLYVGFGILLAILMTVIHVGYKEKVNITSTLQDIRREKLENLHDSQDKQMNEWIISLKKRYEEEESIPSKEFLVRSTTSSKASQYTTSQKTQGSKASQYISSQKTQAIITTQESTAKVISKGISPSKHFAAFVPDPKQQRHVLKYSKSTPGVLNVHIWEGWCGSRVEDLKRNIHFPLYPTVRSNITRFFTQWYETGFGERVFGFIHPPETGNYTFAVSCDDNCEIWLSNDTSPFNVALIASVGSLNEPLNTRITDFKQFKSQISKPFYLYAGKKYFIEGLHKQAAFKDHMLLTWIAPSWSRVKSIGSKYISSFIDINIDNIDVNDYKLYIPVTHSDKLDSAIDKNSLYYYNQTKYKFGLSNSYNETYPIKYINNADIINILPSISYSPSYVLDFIPKRYEGIKLIHETAVYPDDHTELTHMFIYEDCLENRQYDSHKNLLGSYPTFKLPKFTKFAAPTIDTSFDAKYKFIFKNFDRRNVTEKNRQIRESKSDIIHRNGLKNKLLFDIYYKKQRGDAYLKTNFQQRHILSYNNGVNNFKQNSFELMDDLAESQQNDHTQENILRTTMKTKVTTPITINRRSQKQSSNTYSFTPHTRAISSVYYSNYSIQHRSRHNPFLDDHIPLKISKKIFFKDGKSENISVTNSYQMIRMYDIFGPAIYYLSQSKQRGLLWQFKMSRSTCKTDGNLLLSEKVALGIVGQYMKALKQRHSDKYSLKRVVNIEENHDILYGDRYLIELDLMVEKSNEIVRLSRYVYRDIETNKLYEPEDFQWNPQARVHVVVPVKNQGRWVQHFIKNMEKIYSETKDERLNIMLVDFNSTDINITKSLISSGIKNYDVITLDGPFQRTVALQAGLDKVKDEDDIIFTCDLHLEIPSKLVNIIRKHTIKGKMAFAPMVHRLHCGYTPQLPYGLWEIEGFGLFSISKYDFDRVGGMNTKEFKTRWGGEDWELVDRTLAHGIEIERMRVPHFYHYYHSKKRMWSTTKHSTKFFKFDYNYS